MTGRTARGRGAAGPLAAVTLAVSALVVAPGTARAATLFAPPITYVVGSGPADVAVGDLTGDGNDSLAVANTGDGTVSVLLGNGDGTFQPALPYLAGPGPSGVRIGDLIGA
ncbi:hypothetical protein Franean1_4648 [Parafrankia sp. EAN1pec]|uniref:FG-GAP repeat domain-containing protein n=1 Tax=Parafrankia sp. (strain EAN1pec) TaxID=298653 RepID=UPI0000540920|nr:hypothetical protein Franean1_4648 [Frankia sp. EAN1pec]